MTSANTSASNAPAMAVIPFSWYSLPLSLPRTPRGDKRPAHPLHEELVGTAARLNEHLARYTHPVTDSLSPARVEALVGALDAAPEIQEAYLFGSRATGRATAISDIDVAVYIDRPLAPAASAYGYAADLAARLGRAIGRDDVEVVVLNDASPLLYHRAITGGVRILSRDLRATTTREGRALSRYCDYVPQLRRIDAALRARLAAGTFGR